MPKAAPGPAIGSGTAANVRQAAQNPLKRNQACHQCRKKKLKCDAQSPCSACIKTHQYAVKTHPATAPAEPDCTYDSPTGEDPATQARVQELEAKIRLLESRLSTGDGASSNSAPTLGSSYVNTSIYHIKPTEFGPQPSRSTSNPSTLIASSPGTTVSNPSPLPTHSSLNSGSPEILKSNLNTQSFPYALRPVISPVVQSPPDVVFDVNRIPQYFPENRSPEEMRRTAAASAQEFAFPETATTVNNGASPPFFHMTDPQWPPHVPRPELLYHLVDTFFASVPFAHRVLSRPHLMSCLLEPPSSRAFPLAPLLHAICAISSLYTAVVSDGSEKAVTDEIGPESLFNSALGKGKMSDHTVPEIYKSPAPCADWSKMHIEEGAFGVGQAHYFSETWLAAARQGDRLTQLLQASIIITWYYHSVGRAVDTWISVGNLIRTVLPMGLNMGPLWTPISRQPVETLSMYPHSTNDSEKEHLRNLFWLAYSIERVYCAGTVWPLTLQDDDITQLLPLSTHTITHKYIPQRERQRLNTPRVLVTHPPAITDSFTLYIKASYLLGRVKTFNGRWKNQFDEGVPNGMDPRDSATFQMLDSSITEFKLSIPKDFREPMTSDGKLDPILYLALVLPHVAMLLLHDPHASPESPNCMSSERLLASARAILDLIYKVTATSYDLMLLDHSCSFCWFVAAATLIRFLKARILAGDEAETTRLTGELQVIRFMMSSLGARTIVGLRQNLILEDMYNAEIQPLIEKVMAAPIDVPIMQDLAMDGSSGFFGMF